MSTSLSATRTPGRAIPGPPPVPVGTTLRPDATLRRYGHRRVLVGGSPLRALRLRRRAAQLLDGWCAGRPVGESIDERLFARRLLDAGLVHPVAVGGQYTPAEVTLVVPAKDNPAGVARLLAATENLTARIVVDDGSAAPLACAAVRHPAPRGPAAARNTGWRMATTELVAFLDSDTVPEPNWLYTVLPLFHDPDVVAVAPRVRALQPLVRGADRSGRPRHSGHVTARYEYDRSALDLGARPAAVRPLSRVGYVPSAALVVRRSALETLGGFDETLRYGEDVDLAWRLADRCGSVRYQPRAVVHHESRATVRALLKQRFGYGSSAAPLALRHGERLAPARMSRWSALAWLFAATGHPVLGAAIALGTAARLPGRLDAAGVPRAAALGIALRGQLSAGVALAEAVRRTWWPLAVPLALMTARGRRVVASACVPVLVRAFAKRHRLDRTRWAALHVADDLAYGAGVWAGCLRHRTFEPLRARMTERPGGPR